jgi:hypothetical protein
LGKTPTTHVRLLTPLKSRSSMLFVRILGW